MFGRKIIQSVILRVDRIAVLSSLAVSSGYHLPSTQVTRRSNAKKNLAYHGKGGARKAVKEIIEHLRAEAGLIQLARPTNARHFLCCTPM